MRMTFGIILWAGVAETALAHPIDGSLSVALGHQLLAPHHLLFTLALIGLVVYLGRLWHRRNRV
jgi:hypothetical protein